MFLFYRPTHLSSHGVLTFDGLSISTTLVTDSPLLVMDVLVDQMRIFVSDKQHRDIRLKQGMRQKLRKKNGICILYVCTVCISVKW